MHTHIDLRDKVNDNKFLSHLFATFYAIEDVLFAMQSPYRVSNAYCVPLRQGWKFYDTYGTESEHFDFVYYKAPKSLASKMRLSEVKKYKGGPRYNAFNFHSVWYRGTLEVRLHEGLLDERKMLLWAELLQHIVARVESGITYPMLRKLLEMDVSEKKLALFGRIFRLPEALKRYVEDRILSEHGQIRVRRLNYTLGTPTKGRAKSIAPRRTFKPTHRRCRWCSAIVSMNRRCNYCQRAPQFDGSELVDERVMYLPSVDVYGDRQRQAITQEQWNTITGQQVEFAATTDSSEY